MVRSPVHTGERSENPGPRPRLVPGVADNCRPSRTARVARDGHHAVYEPRTRILRAQSRVEATC
jgi:hypothetical protein